MDEAPVVCRELPAGGGKRIGRLTLNVGRTLNSLNREMVDILLERLREWRDDPGIACVFIDAVGDRAFCAGGDVHALHASSVGTPGGPCDYAESFFEQEYRMNHLLHSYLKPVVCWGNGVVMGGGLGVLAACGHRVVTATTRIAMPEVTIALFPDVGGSYFLNRMPGESGLFLALTAASVNAADAIYIGIADYFVGDENRDAVVKSLQATTWTDTTDANHLLAGAVLAKYDGRSESLLPAGHVEPHRELIDQLCNRADILATVARIAALDTDDKWLSRARDGLTGGSPLAALWIHRQLVESADSGLAEIFQSELRLATNIMRDPEFGEGVRALLIDKDRNPRWQYSTWAAVPPAVLDGFFC